METYPRYTITRSASGKCAGFRVSQAKLSAVTIALSLDYVPYQIRAHTVPPRFRIKVATWATDAPIILADAARPAFRGHYRTIESACRAMDNIVRRERGMPERINLPLAEIKAAMSA